MLIQKGQTVSGHHGQHVKTFTQIVFYRSPPLRDQLKRLKIWGTEQTSTAALNVMSTDTVTSLDFCVHCVRFTVWGGWRRVQGHTDGRGWGRDRDTGTETLSVAGKRVFFEGARDRDDLGLKWKRNVESFYPLLRVFTSLLRARSRAQRLLLKIFHLKRSLMRQSGCAHRVPLSPICTSTVRTRLLNWFYIGFNGAEAFWVAGLVVKNTENTISGLLLG